MSNVGVQEDSRIVILVVYLPFAIGSRCLEPMAFFSFSNNSIRFFF